MPRKIGCVLLAALLLTAGLQMTAMADTPFDVNAKSAILVDADTGAIIFAKNEKDHLPIASVTKIMTILLCLEAIDRGEINLDDVMTASENAAGMGGSQVLIETGGQYAVSDLMKSIIVASGNDASVMMAEILAGTEEAFVNDMNERAGELGMEHTHFSNCSGLPADDHYSSAEDVAVMSRELLRHPLFFQYSTIWMDEIEHPGGRITMISNTNKLIRQYGGCDGIKTGSTNDAGFCVSATASKADTRLIAVVLGSTSSKIRFEEATKLLNYGFASYQTTILVNKGDVVAPNLPVAAGKETLVNGIVADRVAVFTEKGNQAKAAYTVEMDENIAAPVARGQKIGEVIVTLGEETVARYDVVSDRAVEQAGVWDYFRRIIASLTASR